MTKVLQLAFCLWVALVPRLGFAAERVALVIGMSNYQFTTKLANTGNDARSVAASLEALNFDVTLLTNAAQQDLISELSSFAFRAETADVALIYYAGHGMEAQGENFLIPVDAQIAAPQDVARYTVSQKDMLNAVYGARKIRIVILDSCRNNPFPGLQVASPEAKIDNPEAGVRGAGGLAPVTPARGTLVAYAQRPGEVAEDGAKGKVHSPFAEALLNALAQPNLEIGMLFRFVRDDVLDATGQRQEPYVTGSLSKAPYFFSGSSEELAVNHIEDAQAAWSSIPAEATKVIKVAAEQGDTRSMVGLTFLQTNPNSEFYDPPAAKAILTQLAESGDADAQYELAKLYEFGLGGEMDQARALQLYQASAAQDNAEALNNLAIFTLRGKLGLVQDGSAALALFERAANLKNPEALYNFAALIDDGAVPGKGSAEAADYLFRSLRVGSQAVLDALSTNPKGWSIETRKGLQQRLAAVELYGGPIDGDFGPGTQKSMRRAFGLDE